MCVNEEGDQHGGKEEVERGAGTLYPESCLRTACPCSGIPTIPFDPNATNLGPQLSPNTLNNDPTQSRPAGVRWSHLATGMAGWSVGKPKPGLRSLAVPRQSPFLSRLRR